MRYFFHIFDGPKVFPDEIGTSPSTPEEAIQQAKFHRGIEEGCPILPVFVVDEDGHRIFECRAS
jgi:hypothetical protein